MIFNVNVLDKGSFWWTVESEQSKHILWMGHNFSNYT
jgi:hypothetical protein